MRRFIMTLLTLLVLTLAVLAPLHAQSGYIQHVVRPGENLYRIALRYGVTMAQIQAANNIYNPNLIYAGSVLQIPSGVVVPTATPTTPVPSVTPGGPTVTPRPPTATVTPRPPTATPVPGTGQTTYVVRPGDTLGTIARRFGTTITAIARANNIVNPNLIYVGQVLIIPGTGPTPVPPTVTPTGPTVTPIPNLNFELGGHVFNFDNAEQMNSAGMTWAKVQIDWKRGQPASIANDAISQADAAGFKILLSLTGDPAELAANPTQYYQEFATFAGQVAALGPDGIEVWNEQNIDREWPKGFISPQAYTQMLSAVSQKVRASGQEVLLISGAPAPTGFFAGTCTTDGCDDDAFIRGMAANNAQQFVDCIGIHYNEGIVPPDQRSGDPRGNSNHYTRYYGTMVDLYSSVFPGKPLCFTELGYLSPEGYASLGTNFNWAQNTTDEQQADYLTRAVALSRQNGRIRMLIVWNVNATNYDPIADPQAGWAIIRPGGTCLACNSLAGAMQ